MSQSPERRRAWSREYRQRHHARLLAEDRARKMRYGRPCLDCGCITDGSNGRAKAPERCARCTAQHLKVWTREVIVEAIRLYAHRYGRPPSAEDFNPSMARARGRDDIANTYYADGDYPQSNTVQREFGSWRIAIEAAGFKSRGIGKRGPGRPRQDASRVEVSS